MPPNESGAWPRTTPSLLVAKRQASRLVAVAIVPPDAGRMTKATVMKAVVRRP